MKTTEERIEEAYRDGVISKKYKDFLLKRKPSRNFLNEALYIGGSREKDPRVEAKQYGKEFEKHTA